MIHTLLGWVSPGAKRGKLSVLIFHRDLPQFDPLFPGEPDTSRFETKMRWIRSCFNVVKLDTAVNELQEGRLPERAMAITFDDGYADNWTVALPILQRFTWSEVRPRLFGAYAQAYGRP